MSIPFLISDILERIIPGSLFVAFLLYALGIDLSEITALDPVFLVGYGFVVSYASGVVFNVLSNRLDFLETRYFLPEETTYRESISRKFAQLFDLPFSSDAWRYCYGIVQKEGLAINTTFFAGMIVFCKSMFVCCATVVGMSLFFVLAPSVAHTDRSIMMIILFVAVLLAAVFISGARSYGRSFTYSILDAFISLRVPVCAPSISV